MKWHTPEIGDRRTVKKFAWIPIYCGNNQTIWLEWYIAEQRYHRFIDGSGWCNLKVTPLKNK